MTVGSCVVWRCNDRQKVSSEEIINIMYLQDLQWFLPRNHIQIDHKTSGSIFFKHKWLWIFDRYVVQFGLFNSNKRVRLEIKMLLDTYGAQHLNSKCWNVRNNIPKIQNFTTYSKPRPQLSILEINSALCHL